MARVGQLTRNHITRIHSILVFNESKTIHELDLSDLSSAMSVEVSFNICLGCCEKRLAKTARLSNIRHVRRHRRGGFLNTLLTIAGEIAQIQSGRGYFSHVAFFPVRRLEFAKVRRRRW